MEKVIEVIETKNRDKVLIKSRNKAKGTYFVEIEIDEDQIFLQEINNGLILWFIKMKNL